MRILIVEDDQGIRYALELLMEFEGYACKAVDRGEEALRFLKEEHFDCVLLDLNTNGISAHEFMKGLPSARPIVGVLSASVSIEFEARQLGAEFFVRKPFDHEELFEQLEKFGGSHQVLPAVAGAYLH